ncbi:SPW repeat domain-containing protein [Halodurantibacterium flavum]|uniref:SPW repeat-containing integral membrane domain-containing protein n=1 Tax=Halodurantibacterium flavum TaxID=1382802 RepID=A0ABW4RZ74_9RHOB
MIDTRTHGILDYVTGAVLIVAPYVFGFATGGVEQWLPQVLGAMTIVMSLLTRYELSLSKIIPLKVHLAVDMGSGALLAVSPWLFGFAPVIWWPHLLVGLLEIVVPLLTRREERAE